ncbi:MAG: 2-C-methyl-D-erythritol 4-phosphate cytidylyltransferase [Candidatus Omnitrophota bacterium]|nr:2-C-methyl-D-erythritol 4-phosphate cytidylyltransferase [Candidatus Omnitrophota bacterium]
MLVSAIVVAAGKSKRFKTKTSKVILKLGSKPVIVYSLGILNEHPKIKEIIIVANPQNFESLRGIIKKNKFYKAVKVVLGGKKRKDSVAAGLRVINSKADFVLIHDAARPFITRDLVSLVINEAYESKAAILGVPVKATIKRCKLQGAECMVKETIDRKNIWEVQTPQVFARDLILKAYQRFSHSDATDDAMLVERLGAKVSVVLGSYKNIKITTPEDFIIAKGVAYLWKPA